MTIILPLSFLSQTLIYMPKLSDSLYLTEIKVKRHTNIVCKRQSKMSYNNKRVDKWLYKGIPFHSSSSSSSSFHHHYIIVIFILIVIVTVKVIVIVIIIFRLVQPIPSNSSLFQPIPAFQKFLVIKFKRHSASAWASAWASASVSAWASAWASVLDMKYSPKNTTIFLKTNVYGKKQQLRQKIVCSEMSSSKGKLYFTLIISVHWWRIPWLARQSSPFS